MSQSDLDAVDRGIPAIAPRGKVRTRRCAGGSEIRTLGPAHRDNGFESAHAVKGQPEAGH